MSPSPVTIIYAFLGGLLLAAVVAWIKKSRLAILAPKNFIFQHVSNSGELAEITIFNRGFKTEESVEISLNPRLKYQLVGQTLDNVTLSENKLSVSKIGASADISLVLLVEGGQFAKTDIISAVSKETSGSIYDSLELVPQTGWQRIGSTIIFMVIPSIMLLLFLKYSDAGKEFLGEDRSAETVKEENVSKKGSPDGKDYLFGWSFSDYHETTAVNLLKDLQEGSVQIKIGAPVFKGNIATVPFEFSNRGATPLEAMIEVISGETQDALNVKNREFGVLIFPGKVVEKKLQVKLKRNSPDPIDRTAFVEVRLEQNGGERESISMERTVVFDRE
jgi:hypothetical protein